MAGVRNVSPRCSRAIGTSSGSGSGLFPWARNTQTRPGWTPSPGDVAVILAAIEGDGDDVRAALARCHGGLHDPARDRQDPSLAEDVDGEARAARGGGAGDSKSNARIPDVSSGTRSVGSAAAASVILFRINAAVLATEAHIVASCILLSNRRDVLDVFGGFGGLEGFGGFCRVGGGGGGSPAAIAAASAFFRRRYSRSRRRLTSRLALYLAAAAAAASFFARSAAAAASILRSMSSFSSSCGNEHALRFASAERRQNHGSSSPISRATREGTRRHFPHSGASQHTHASIAAPAPCTAPSSGNGDIVAHALWSSIAVGAGRHGGGGGVGGADAGGGSSSGR